MVCKFFYVCIKTIFLKVNKFSLNHYQVTRQLFSSIVKKFYKLAHFLGLKTSQNSWTCPCFPFFQANHRFRTYTFVWSCRLDPPSTHPFWLLRFSAWYFVSVLVSCSHPERCLHLLPLSILILFHYLFPPLFPNWTGLKGQK